jgi:hypothetical protein
MESNLAPLPIVFAHRDKGILGQMTRWKPRLVSCSGREDHREAKGTDYVAKYRRPDPESAAALISEVVCYTLLRAMRVRTLEAALVSVSPALALSYTRDDSVNYEILPGLHFGTVYRHDFQPADPELWDQGFWEQLADPAELIQIWAADCWLMNLDREVFGNVLLDPGKIGKWHLVPADQSDCFLGAGVFANGCCFERSPTHGPADYLPLLERAFLELGCSPLYQVLNGVYLLDNSGRATARPAIG